MRRCNIVLLVLCACGGASGERGSAPPAAAAAPAAPAGQSAAGQGTGTGMCPLVQAGARLSATELADGAALIVELPGERLDWGRAYLRDMVKQHEDRRTSGGAAAHRERLPAHASSVENTDTGARVIFRPINPGDLPALVAGVRQNAERLPASCRGSSSPAL